MLGKTALPRKADHHGRPLATRIRAAVFRTLYGPGARWYDQLTDRLFLGEWKRWQLLVLRDLPERGTVVELGAGTGVLAAAGATAERRWIAVDASPSMLAQAARRRTRGGACLLRASSEALPLADHCCNAIVATFPSDYILSPATHMELQRIITPGGKLIVVLSAELRPSTPRRWFRRVALRLFYGSAHHPQPVLSIDGFVGEVGVTQTDFGSAAVLRATRAPARKF